MEVGETVGRPIPPNPSSFGIDAQYFEVAVEGARLWADRKRLMPRWVKWAIRIAFVTTPGAILLFTNNPGSAVGGVLGSGLYTLLVAEGVIQTLEKIHDRRLKRMIFNPRYNPNPDAYRKYAAEYAKYETHVAEVYISRNWIYHSREYCCGMNYYESMPRWKAMASHASPCSHCGYPSVPPRKLPRPFGKGFLPGELEELIKKDEERRREAQERMDETYARMVADIQKKQEREKLKQLKRQKK